MEQHGIRIDKVLMATNGNIEINNKLFACCKQNHVSAIFARVFLKGILCCQLDNSLDNKRKTYFYSDNNSNNNNNNSKIVCKNFFILL